MINKILFYVSLIGVGILIYQLLKKLYLNLCQNYERNQSMVSARVKRTNWDKTQDRDLRKKIRPKQPQYEARSYFEQ